jgi:hypothetical protein
MPRIIVTTDHSQLPDYEPIMLDERVHSVHLSTGHAAAQLIQRLAWAISDAERAEHASPQQRSRPVQRPLRRPLATRPRARLPIGA